MGTLDGEGLHAVDVVDVLALFVLLIETSHHLRHDEVLRAQ